MKKRTRLSLVVCLFFAGLSVGKAEITIQLVSLFHYPGPDSGGLVTGQINDSNILVGYAHFKSGIEGFYSHRGGQFSAPFREPDDTGALTIAKGINNHQALCGYYRDGVDFTTKGFVRMGERYSSFVAPVQGQVSATLIYSINDADNFVDSYNKVTFVTAKAFAVIDGVFTTLPIPGALEQARGINNLNQIVGYYSYLTSGDGFIFHGYLLDADGSLMNVDFPGAKRTRPMAINDAGFIVGSWYDGVATHGCLIQLPSTFISYDVPGAINTIFTGVNNNGTICGTYRDARTSRGFIAQIQTDK
jgi:hypothetical protein